MDVSTPQLCAVCLIQVSLAMSRGVSRQDGSYQMMMNATYHYRPVVGYEKQYSVVIVMFDEDTQLQQKQFSSSSHKVHYVIITLSLSAGVSYYSSNHIQPIDGRWMYIIFNLVIFCV